MFSDNAKLKSFGAYLFWFGLIAAVISPVAFYFGLLRSLVGGGPTPFKFGLGCFVFAGFLMLGSYLVALTIRRKTNQPPWYLMCALLGLLLLSIPSGYFLLVLLQDLLSFLRASRG